MKYALLLLSLLISLQASSQKRYYPFERFSIEDGLQDDTVKTQLYTNITREFRTPLTVIMGMADQVVKDPGQYLSSGISAISLWTRLPERISACPDKAIISKKEARGVNSFFILHWIYWCQEIKAGRLDHYIHRKQLVGVVGVGVPHSARCGTPTPHQFISEK